ncbi:olfactory receptor 1N1-like [Bufo gargarizans]|uniref:olfactory receptor 1N1-like n=1 Tax=Bufo gargarizans TaxID=30331 RepID=UPI001CF4A838|nr:olfactory receptor 1N1-like [Bufo gargarizans]
MQVNQTPVTYFIIKGISDDPQLQILIFLLVLLMYLFILCGNLTILFACQDSHLHIPMYFFLGNLSLLDISCSTISLHKILIHFITGDRTVSYTGCMVQMHMFGSTASVNLLILTAMGYDRYVAICKPLQYHMVMKTGICAILASACWVLGSVQVIPFTFIVCRFSCYSSIEINHFFCDIVPVMKISCDDTSVLEMLFFIEGLLTMILIPFVLTFVSYIFIIYAILRIRTNSGRLKAFYTCSSHLTVVILLYSTLFSQYLTLNHSSTLKSIKLFALFNTAAVPLLNPIIYSLKNKDVKMALKRSCVRLDPGKWNAFQPSWV